MSRPSCGVTGSTTPAPARSSRTGNAGLGLAIAKEIVEAHGGSITAQSQDQQIRFTVTLPAP